MKAFLFSQRTVFVATVEFQKESPGLSLIRGNSVTYNIPKNVLQSFCLMYDTFGVCASEEEYRRSGTDISHTDHKHSSLGYFLCLDHSGSDLTEILLKRNSCNIKDIRS